MNEEFKQNVEEIKSRDVSNIARSELGTTLNFGDASKKLLAVCNDLIDILAKYDTFHMSDHTKGDLVNIAKQANQLIKRINVFKGDDSNAFNQRQSIINEINSIYNSFFDNLHSKTTLLIKFNETRDKSFEEQKDKLKNDLIETEKIKKEAEKILEGIRDASGKSASVISASDFAEEAKQHVKISKRWLAMFVIMIFLTFTISVLLFEGLGIFSHLSVRNIDPNNTYQIIHFTVYKLLIISLAYLFTYQCLKNYKIHRHLSVLNTHRQNVLKIYPLMVNAAEGETKQVIIKEAATSMFNLSGTGYLDSDQTPPPINLTEVVNKLTERK